MRYVLILLLLVFSVAARDFTGTAEIKVIPPDDTQISVCPPNQKYLMEPNSSLTTKLYTRNYEANKTIEWIDLKLNPPSGFTAEYEPAHLSDIGPGVVKYFNVTIHASPDVKPGDYYFQFLLATNEGDYGAYEETILIRVRTWSNEALLFCGIAIIFFLGFAVWKYFWIYKVNHAKPHRRRKKAISKKYYKA